MMFYCLEPEVAGSLGKHTVWERSETVERVVRPHYQFDGWLGDDLLESYPVFIVTAKLAARIEQDSLSGVSFDEVLVSLPDVFVQLYPDVASPEFRWMRISGRAGEDDFGIPGDRRLVASERALSVLRSGALANCDVEEYRP